MSIKVLVAYGSRCGATAEIAERISETLCASGAETVVSPVGTAASAAAFNAVVIGSAARFGRLLPEVLSYARRNAAFLAELPTAYFVTGLTLRENTPENRRQAASYLSPLIEVRKPIATGLFGGLMDYSRLPRHLRFVLAHDTSQTLPEGDFRNWSQITEWAAALARTIEQA